MEAGDLSLNPSSATYWLCASFKVRCKLFNLSMPQLPHLKSGDNNMDLLSVKTELVAVVDIIVVCLGLRNASWSGFSHSHHTALHLYYPSHRGLCPSSFAAADPFCPASGRLFYTVPAHE